jgi:hypothetical protein
VPASGSCARLRHWNLCFSSVDSVVGDFLVRPAPFRTLAGGFTIKAWTGTLLLKADAAAVGGREPRRRRRSGASWQRRTRLQVGMQLSQVEGGRWEFGHSTLAGSGPVPSMRASGARGPCLAVREQNLASLVLVVSRCVCRIQPTNDGALQEAKLHSMRLKPSGRPDGPRKPTSQPPRPLGPRALPEARRRSGPRAARAAPAAPAG